VTWRAAASVRETVISVEVFFLVIVHSSLRMTFGRWTTETEIDFAIETIKLNVAKLRDLSPLWEMYQDGIDISTIQWAAH